MSVFTYASNQLLRADRICTKVSSKEFRNVVKDDAKGVSKKVRNYTAGVFTKIAKKIETKWLGIKQGFNSPASLLPSTEDGYFPYHVYKEDNY